MRKVVEAPTEGMLYPALPSLHFILNSG